MANFARVENKCKTGKKCETRRVYILLDDVRERERKMVAGVLLID